MIFVLSALSMTVGNLIALRQTNVVRMLAYSGIAQAGFILAPFAVAHEEPALSYSAIVIYLVIYAAMNLGAFAVVIALARKTRSAELSSFGGSFTWAPGLTVLMTIGAGTGWGWGLAVILAVNTAIAAYYYLRVARAMWFEPAPDGDNSPVKIPTSLRSALAITVVATMLFGILPGILSDASQIGVALGR